jgi:hypothetical protein
MTRQARGSSPAEARLAGEGEADERRLVQPDRQPAPQHGLAGCHGVGHLVEPEHGKPAPVRSRQHVADDALAHRHGRALLRPEAIEKDDWHDARAGRAAMLHARDHFLPDIAALAEGDAAKLVHQRLMREGELPAIAEIAAAGRYAQPDPVRVIIVLGSASQRGNVRRINNGALAHAGMARIGEDNAAIGSECTAVDRGHDRSRVGQVLDNDLGAQLVEHQPAGKIGQHGARHIDQEAAAILFRQRDDEEIDDDLALRGQQRAIAGDLRGDEIEIIAEQPVEEAARIRTSHLEHAAVRQVRGRFGAAGHRGGIGHAAASGCNDRWSAILVRRDVSVPARRNPL